MAQKGATISNPRRSKGAYIRIELDMPYVQQPILIPHSYEGRLPSRPGFDVRTNIFGDIWTSHKSLGFSNTSYRG
jgi:hypothetical protein